MVTVRDKCCAGLRSRLLEIIMISTQTYLRRTEILLKHGQYTDGCSTPFKTFIHRWLKKSRMLCAAHDFGSLGLIQGVQPGWQNNVQTLIAHWSQGNPVYWVWGTIVAVATLPWVVWRRNFNIDLIPIVPFHIFMLLFGTFFTLYKFYG